MKVECWLVLKGRTSQYGPSTYPTNHPYAGQRRIDSVKAVKLSQNKPTVEGDSLAIKVEVDIDEGWFLDLGGPVLQAQVPSPPPPTPQKVKVDMPVRHRTPSPATAVLRQDP